ncbi:HAD family hydrolase [Actinokineospora inagensis]|uniref:HAD family hydrolase n=1 Tax=Actinokineospora inagensis TaxID=103730 RepID=UPI0004205581|nr:haloacid dehalogenase-like hydrolase [Actinokineospora inagensis]
MTTKRTLVLWDVDQTLVDYPGAGRDWYARALSAVFDQDLIHSPQFGGRTDRYITVQLLEAHGIECTDEQVERVYAKVIAIAGAERDGLAGLGRILPGAVEVLRDLADRPEVVQSLVTGNLAELAEVKLAAFDLLRYVDFEVGGYGAVSADRHELIAAARTAAEAKYGTVFAPGSVVVIGDTPHDIAAARHHGAVAVGVATGRHSVEELVECGADVVLVDLSDPAAVIATLLRTA